MWSSTLLAISSLALFIFGMKTMSEALQRYFGPGLRRYLSEHSKSSAGGVISGLFTTALIQSSSTTTVMVVSFVNSGLIRLRQAIYVIMGANIGTTITGWIIVLLIFSQWALKPSALILLIIGVPIMYIRQKRMKFIGEALVGLTLWLVGVELLNQALMSVEALPPGALTEFLFERGDVGLWTILQFVLIGALATSILQASSVTMALVLALLYVGMPLELGIALVLGENVGTTITANIVAASGNVHAKRAARAHLVFNLIGVIIALVSFPWIISLFRSQFETGLLGSSILAPLWAVCLFHTLFNILTTGIVFGFADKFADLIQRVIKPKDEDDKLFALIYMNISPQSSELSLKEAEASVAKMAKVVAKMVREASAMLVQMESKRQTKSLNKIRKYEQVTDDMESQIADYLNKAGQLELTIDGSTKIQRMFGVIIELERIADLFYVVSRALERKTNSKTYFIPRQRRALIELFDLVEKAIEMLIEDIEQGLVQTNADESQKVQDEIAELYAELKIRHIKDLEKVKYSMQSGIIYSDIFANLERIADHVDNATKVLKETP